MLHFCRPSRYRRPIAVALLLVLCVALASPVFAWNGLGHKVVAEIAWQQLDRPTRQQIVDTVRRHPRFAEDFEKKMSADVATADKAVQDHWVFQQAATWPDIARKTDYDRPSWHFINVPLFLDGERPVKFNLSMDYPTDVEQENYSVAQATKHRRVVLADREAGADAKALAYSWLFHLVGDIHQPLHSTALVCEHFPDGDRGGNEVPVVQVRNLHALWDGLLGTRSRMRDVDHEVAKLKEHTELWDVDAKLDIDGWVAESHDAAASVVYDPAILQAVRSARPGDKLEPISLSTDYLNAAGQLARRRIVAAGLRLGALLQPNADKDPDYSHRIRLVPCSHIRAATSM
jgi:hypothetical protein